jgi:hypothetical protein
MLNPWIEFSFQAARLGWEAQNVIALRLLRLARGGAIGRSEAGLLITEKLSALSEAQTAAASAAIKGGNGRQVATKVMKVYKNRVRANKRRLSK